MNKEEVFSQLARFSTYKQDWNGNNAAPLSEICKQTSLFIIDKIFQHFKIIDAISFTADSEISITSITPSFEIDICPDGGLAARLNKQYFDFTAVNLESFLIAALIADKTFYKTLSLTAGSFPTFDPDCSGSWLIQYDGKEKACDVWPSNEIVVIRQRDGIDYVWSYDYREIDKVIDLLNNDR